MANQFTLKVKSLIKQIPEGKVCTYGFLAGLAGNPGGARQVARILHSCSEKDGLPWHRVVNRYGKISLRPDDGYDVQRQLLETEGIAFGLNDAICLDSFLWMPQVK
ncbi:MAG: MGMT family protein [Deltaproteobacteria bacterium]|nr:MGMT family protein [Deltaproteobacteria bacterium]